MDSNEEIQEHLQNIRREQESQYESEKEAKQLIKSHVEEYILKIVGEKGHAVVKKHKTREDGFFNFQTEIYIKDSTEVIADSGLFNNEEFDPYDYENIVKIVLNQIKEYSE